MIRSIVFKDTNNAAEFNLKKGGAPFEKLITIQDFKFGQYMKYKQHISKFEYKNDLVGKDVVSVTISALLINRDSSVDQIDRMKDFRTFTQIIAMLDKGMFETMTITFDSNAKNSEIIDISDFFRLYMNVPLSESIDGRITDVSCSSTGEGIANLSIAANFVYKGDEV